MAKLFKPSIPVRFNFLHPQPSLFLFCFGITPLVFFFLSKSLFLGFLTRNRILSHRWLKISWRSSFQIMSTKHRKTSRGKPEIKLKTRKALIWDSKGKDGTVQWRDEFLIFKEIVNWWVRGSEIKVKIEVFERVKLIKDPKKNKFLVWVVGSGGKGCVKKPGGSLRYRVSIIPYSH